MKSEMKEDQEAISNSSPCEETNPRQVSELINSLISCSYSIKPFPVKWQLIQNKLEQLNSGLIAAAGNHNSGDNSVLSELLQAVTSTVNETQVLVQRCADETYTGGKLLMRSDLDVVASRLDLHMKALTGIYASGILTHSNAIVVSRPGVGASREDMRFYVKDLFSRLKIGDLEMKTRALTALNEILCEDEKYMRIVFTEITYGASILVNLLEFEDMGIQEEATKAVSVIAEFNSYKGELVVAGVIAPLIRVVEVGGELGKERAARALKKLTENSDNAWSVSAQGGVTALLKICGDANSKGELIGSACGVLRNLSGVGEIRRFMVEEKAISVFIKLSRSKEELSQIQAIEFLRAIASEDDIIKQAMVREGLIESLVQILDPNSPYSSKAREIALRAIEGLCFSSTNSMNVLMGSKFLDWVLFFLRNGEISIQELALKAASRLCGISEEIKKVMGDAGFMPEFVRLLEAKSLAIREMAAEALCSLVSVQKNRRRFIQEEHNVNRILQLLNPEEEKSVTKKFLLSMLMSLTNSNSGRRKIVASGYLKNLEKLAETDATDAKKIVKKLSGNRFRNILNGIWSS